MSEFGDGFLTAGAGVLVSLHDGDQVGGRILGFSESGLYVAVTVRLEERGLVEASDELVRMYTELCDGWSRVRLVGSHVLRGDLYGARMSRGQQVMSEGRYLAFRHMVEQAEDMILVNVHSVRTHIDHGSVKLIELWEDVNAGRVLSGLDFAVDPVLLSDSEDSDVSGT